MPLSTRITIPFGDTDQAGFVYYPNLFHYCHIAMERFFDERAGVPYSELIKDDRIGFPTVKIESQFSEPFLYGDEVEIQVSVASVGRSSVTLDYRFFRLSNMAVCAEVKMVHVAMSLDTHRAVPIPEKLRTSLFND